MAPAVTYTPSIPTRAIVSPTEYTAKSPLVSVDSLHDPNLQYSYSYGVNDASTGDAKSHEESRSGDIVQGSYSVVESDGSVRKVDYSADDVNGFNAIVHRTIGAVAPPPVTVRSVASVSASPFIAKVASPASSVPALAVKSLPPVGYQSPPHTVEYKSSPVLDIKPISEDTFQTFPAATYKFSPALDINPLPEVAFQTLPAAMYKSFPTLDIKPIREVTLQTLPAATYKSFPTLDINSLPEVTFQTLPAATYKSSPALDIKPIREVTLQPVPAVQYKALPVTLQPVPAVQYKALPVTQQLLPPVAANRAHTQPAIAHTSVQTQFAKYQY